MSRPLLSICVPTWNRSALLELTLATVVPQTESLSEFAECVVSDNGSTDGTREIAGHYTGRASFRYFRNESNLGPNRNYSLLFSERARGEFVWFVGDDDVLMQGAVQKVVDALSSVGDKIDFLSFNYLAVDLVHRPAPKDARGGVAIAPGQLMRTRAREGFQPFDDLLDGEGQAFTPAYSFVARRADMVRAYSPAVLATPPYESVEATYPHAVMLASEMVRRPAYYISAPLLTVYRWPVSVYSWAPYVPLVGTVRYAEVLRRYLDNGVPLDRLRPYFKEVSSNAGELLPRILWDKESAGGIASVARLFAVMPCYRRQTADALIRALRDPRAPLPIRITMRVILAITSRVQRALRFLSG